MNKNENFGIEFYNNLSAYIDNELDYAKNIRIKKLTISNSYARKELENMYKFRKLLNSAYEKSKTDLKKDFSKIVTSKVSTQDYYSTTFFQKIVILFVVIMCAIIGGFIYLYH